MAITEMNFASGGATSADKVLFDNTVAQLPNNPDNVQNAIEEVVAKGKLSFCFNDFIYFTEVTKDFEYTWDEDGIYIVLSGIWSANNSGMKSLYSELTNSTSGKTQDELGQACSSSNTAQNVNDVRIITRYAGDKDLIHAMPQYYISPYSNTYSFKAMKISEL